MTRRTWLAVGLVLVVVGVVISLARLAGVATESQIETFSDVTAVEFDLANSPIEFEVGGEEMVVDYSVSRGIFGGGGATLEQRGERLVLDQRCPAFIFSWGCRATFHVTLPPDVEVSGVTSNGAIEVAGVDAPLDISTSNGAITLRGVTADVTVRTSNGAITGGELGSDRFDAVTSNGRINLEFADVPSTISARTSNGAIDVALPPNAPPYSVEASTSNGMISTDVRTDPSAPASILVASSNGDIAVRYRD